LNTLKKFPGAATARESAPGEIDGVGGGRKREVIDLARLYDGNHREKVIRREPREVIDTISGVAGCKLSERGWKKGRKVKDVDAVVAKDAKVVRGSQY
jgi:hypothetical protein